MKINLLNQKITSTNMEENLPEKDTDKKPENPLAFPGIPLEKKHSNGTLETTYSKGMTLRDYFAAKAMQGLITSDIPYNGSKDRLVQDAYEFADAMLKQRNDSSTD